MMHRTTILFAGVIAVTAAAACPAMAGVYYETYTGTVSGVDTNGVFGTAGATLNGAVYSSTYSYDPSTVQVNTGTGVTWIYGGSSDGYADPLLTASLMINGHTYNQSSTYFGDVQLANNSANVSLYDYAASSGSNYLENLENFGNTSFQGLVNPSFTALQSFALPYGTGNGYFNYNGEYLTLTETYFAVTNVAPSPPTAVPEPGSTGLLAGAVGVFAAVIGVCRAVSSRRFGTCSGLAVV